MDVMLTPSLGLKGKIKIPGDKSISHRSVILGALAEGITNVENFLDSEDCNNTVEAFFKMGVNIKKDGTNLRITGVGLEGLKEPQDIIDVGNSGTSIRLLMGVASAQSFTTIFTGDSSIRRRPMERVIKPLKEMGAEIISRNGGKAPLAVRGCTLKPISYDSPVASAQIKSAILLAGLFTSGVTKVTEPHKSRSHSEIMLKGFGANLEDNDNTVSIRGRVPLKGRDVIVPGDISSAAFFMVAGLIIPDSQIILEGVGLNPTRTGIIDVLLEMGGSIKILNPRANSIGEQIGDIEVKSSHLKGTIIGGSIIPRLIDEVPIISVAAAFAQGNTVIKDAQELKVKESDRIATTAKELSKFGVNITEEHDGLIISGSKGYNGSVIESHGDHRIAMASFVCALASKGNSTIQNTQCIATSFPNFFQLMKEGDPSLSIQERSEKGD